MIAAFQAVPTEYHKSADSDCYPKRFAWQKIKRDCQCGRAYNPVYSQIYLPVQMKMYGVYFVAVSKKIRICNHAMHIAMFGKKNIIG
jgi:hypothetical protein